MSKKPRGHVSVSAPTFESIRREARRRGVPLAQVVEAMCADLPPIVVEKGSIQ